MVYNIARNPMGTVPNVPLDFALGKELHPHILSTITIHGGQVNREIRDKQAISHNILSVFPAVPTKVHIEVDLCKFEVKVLFNELLEH